MAYTVIVSFGVVTEAGEPNLPDDINMEFEEAQSWDAIEYFTTAVRYHEDAVKWDPSYYGIGAMASLWHGNKMLCKKRIGA